MSAATFQRLREEFARGWVELGGKQFTIHIFTPGFIRAGHNPHDPNWKEILPFDWTTDKVIGGVHLPYSVDTDDRDNFTNTPGFVVVQPAPSFMATNDASLFTGFCELFKRCSNEAGAALPEVIRKRLAGYCTWQCNSPASWWFALLAHMTGKIVYHSDGTYNDHNFISGPWELSIRLIDHFGLNTDSPTWPEAEAKSGEQGKSSTDDWCHAIGTDPPQEFYRAESIAASKTVLGFLVRHRNQRDVKDPKWFRDSLEIAAKNSRVWCRATTVRDEIEVFFKDNYAFCAANNDLSEAKTCIAKLSEQVLTGANGRRRVPTGVTSRRKSK